MSALDVDAVQKLLGRPVSFVARLTGGEHARTTVVTDGVSELVVRRFPPGDAAVNREVGVLARLTGLGDLVPRLVAHDDDDPAGPVIVTERLDGGPPGADVPLPVVAEQMAGALARVHVNDGTGLRGAPLSPPVGGSPVAERVRQEWPHLDRSQLVLTHYDFWCGNAVWRGHALIGVVDWSGARHAPRGVDVAWCRLDLVLMGSARAADTFVAAYGKRAGVALTDVPAWDRLAAALADEVVQDWAPNYAGVGRPDLTPGVLRRRLDDWTRALLH